MSKLIIFCFLFSFVLPLTRAIQMEEFFPALNGNLTKITWTHSIYSPLALNKSLKSNNMMIASQVVLGKLYNSRKPKNQPVMAQPPNIFSQLLLETFLTTVRDSNDRTKYNKKGIKLDFTTTKAFEYSTAILRKFYSKEVNFPVWLHADILADPSNATDKPVDAKVFIRNCQEFKNAIISLGWLTQFTNGIEKVDSESNIKEMISVIEENKNGTNVPPVTFYVHAGIAAQSNEQLLGLLDEVKNSTLTIWGSHDNVVDVESLRNLIKDATIKKVYLDLPGNVLEELRLDQIITAGTNQKNETDNSGNTDNAGISFKPFGLITAIVSTLLVPLF